MCWQPARPPPRGRPSRPPNCLPARWRPCRGWQFVAVADAEHHGRIGGEIPFPAFCPDRRFVLTGTRLLTGRRSRSRGIEPDVDLSGPPEDPGVSHAHAMLLAGADGGWSVVDLGSANGTYLNDGTDPIEADRAHPLRGGDRLHIGAWTTLILQAAAGSSGARP
ncbi:FHA domain-containing protein [Dactylosporangium roseum]|uniref:FHA domain-containing protein n=1 Tax=Dactylosporangium roseum TaxID=47989 RepID=A0ABY5ZF14_9ACTN|nr:FHA domain-containing protein [Dactylosporangium roseum]UWZ39243.1 FHA domain-containing protein [Dactylosporangium roseum]